MDMDKMWEGRWSETIHPISALNNLYYINA